MRRIAWLTAFVILSLVLVACGATEEAAPTATPVPEPTATEVVEEPTPAETAPEAESIVDIAVADGRFTTLVTALQAAGLAETLAGEGEYTVFAPAD
ncbi:MAG: fasciclin domain-containing protein, partial [Candidatus Promineifilaceae bacterium]|nr:fasciclin domain-containing protein [Candidatus Promineifilaceae bacterium]